MWYKHSINLCLTAIGACCLLTACSKDEIPAQDTPQAISFSAVSTRAAITDGKDMTEFRVWASYAKDGKTNTVFDGEAITKNEKGAWTYQDTKYWVDGATYQFHALHGAATAAMNSEGTAITCTGFDCSKGHDLMTAAENISTPKPIVFGFTHRLAKVTINIKAATGVTAAIKSAKLYGMNYKGDFSYSLVNQNMSWNNTSSASSTDTPFTYQKGETVSGNGQVAVFNELLLLPQQINGATLAVTLNRGQGEEILTVTLPQTTWEENNAYVYTSTVEQTGITFTDFTVQEWNYSYSGGSVNIQ